MIKHDIPNKAFDIEYSTQYKKEYQWLIQHGFQCTYIKINNDYGIRTYKFKKSAALFAALSMFYDMDKKEKEYDKIAEEMANATITMSGKLGDKKTAKDFFDKLSGSIDIQDTKQLETSITTALSQTGVIENA